MLGLRIVPHPSIYAGLPGHTGCIVHALSFGGRNELSEAGDTLPPTIFFLALRASVIVRD